MDREVFLDLIPAYALGALDDEERAEFEVRLAADHEAQTLLAEYQVVSQGLVLATPGRAAPNHLGDDLRRRIAAHSMDSPTAVQPTTPRSPLLMRWLSAAAILAVVFGVTWALTQTQPPAAEPVCPNTQQLYQQIVSTQGYVRLALSPAEEFATVTGELVADPGTNAAIMHIRHLPALSEDRTYQLWLAGPDQTVSGGLFQGAGSDTCIILPLEHPLVQYSGFGVSLEAAGGSPDPNGRTGPRVLNVRLGDA